MKEHKNKFGSDFEEFEKQFAASVRDFTAIKIWIKLHPKYHQNSMIIITNICILYQKWQTDFEKIPVLEASNENATLIYMLQNKDEKNICCDIWIENSKKIPHSLHLSTGVCSSKFDPHPVMYCPNSGVTPLLDPTVAYEWNESRPDSISSWS